MSRLLPRLALLTIVAATGLTAQEYNPRRLDAQKVKFVVHQKLAAVPIMLGAGGPHLRARYKPEDESDYIRGDYSWELFVLEFPNEAPRDATREFARNFDDWVHNKDVGRNERTFVEKDKKVAGRTGSPDHRYYEYYDVDDRFGYWYRLAAVYTVEDHEVALMVNIPAIGKPKPSDTYFERAQRMVTSLEVLTPEELAAGAGSDAELDRFADTDLRKQTLATAKKNIANLQHWGYFTTKEYIVLYSWDASNAAKQGDSRAFADAMVAELEDFRAVYAADFPPHEQMLGMYPILRICEDAQEFHQYGGEHSKDRVGWYNGDTGELVMFNDRTRRVADEETIKATVLHEGWHQYANSFFGARVELHPWYDEGLGEYYGAFVKKGKKWRYEVPRKVAGLVKAQVSRKTSIPLRDFVGWKADNFQSERATDHYAQAYALVDFLRRGPEKLGKKFPERWQQILPIYTDTVRKTRNRSRALKDAFEGVDWDAFEDAWQSWVKSKLK